MKYWGFNKNKKVGFQGLWLTPPDISMASRTRILDPKGFGQALHNWTNYVLVE